MQKDCVAKIVRNEAIKYLIRNSGLYYIPVAVSNRHVHLSLNDVERLYGKRYELKPVRWLSQPGQFVCFEKISIEGPKGVIRNVRVLGPVRKETQVEISISDSYLLGVTPVVRMSGDLDGTPGIKLIGPEAEVNIPKGLIVSARHLHISPEEAEWYGLKDRDVIRVKKSGVRETVFDNVVVRSSSNDSLEMHMDTDEANAANLTSGDLILLDRCI